MVRMFDRETNGEDLGRLQYIDLRPATAEDRRRCENAKR
jgi:hypothetical protein